MPFSNSNFKGNCYSSTFLLEGATNIVAETSVPQAETPIAHLPWMMTVFASVATELPAAFDAEPAMVPCSTDSRVARGGRAAQY